MFRKFFLITVLLSIFSFPVRSQQRCVTEEVEKIRREKDSSVPSIEEFERWMQNKIRSRKYAPSLMRREGTKEEPLTIPVVIHVIHNGEPVGQGVNIPDEQIYSQIEVLNEDFQRQNPDTINTQDDFIPVAGLLNVQFVLAKSDPTGCTTSGIIRVQGSQTSWSHLQREALSAESYWPAEDYLNIWVTSLRNNYLGIAQYPDIDLPGLEDEDKENRLTDGVVIHYEVFGSEDKYPAARLQPPFDKGRTCTHELGHFFGLRHVWGDNTFDCSVDDYVMDTPESTRSYNGICPGESYSCSTKDMYENFLYYTSDACMNIFSSGQVERMEVVLEDAPRRASLLTSDGALPPSEICYDMGIQSINSPGIINCEAMTIVDVTIVNNGTKDASGFDLEYSLTGFGIETIEYRDTIRAKESVTFQVLQTNLDEGQYDLALHLEIVDDEQDINQGNNSVSQRFAVDFSNDFIPLRQQFDDLNSGEAYWATINIDDDIGWELKDSEGLGSPNTSAFVNLYDYSSLYEEDWLVSPSLDFSEAYEASLFFKTSYAKRSGRNDVLKVLLSADCGVHFDDKLLELKGSLLSSITAEQYWMPSVREDWEDFSIDLTEYAGQENIRVAFVTVNENGNNIFLDDIEFFTTSREDVVDTEENSFLIYPNPARNGLFQVVVNNAQRSDLELAIYDAYGRTIYSGVFKNALNQTYDFDLSVQSTGTYIIKLAGKDFVRSKKVVILR